MSGLLLALLAGCNFSSCGQQAVLMSPASCQEPLASAHHQFYDDTEYAWVRACPDKAQSGVLRIGAVLPTASMGCVEAEGPCTPCVPAMHGECARTVEGLTGNHLVSSGDRPLGAGYFLSCEDAQPTVMFFFQDAEGEPVRTCRVDADGNGRCDDECRLTFQLNSAAP